MNIYDYIINDYKPDMGKRLRACRLQSNLTLLFLSHFFHVSLDYLLKGEGEKDSFPFALIEIYQSCPDDKKEYLIELIKNLDKLIQSKKDA